jgi:acyl carrier protein
MNELQTTLVRLRALFSETFHVDPPPCDVDLLENGLLDSLQVAQLLVQLEQRFGTRISIEAIDLDDLRTLGRIARLVIASGARAGCVDARRPDAGDPGTTPRVTPLEAAHGRPWRGSAR